MLSTTIDKSEAGARRLGTPVIETAHEVWLAGLGALSLARRESVRVARQGNELFERLVSEGGKYEIRLRKVAEDRANEVADRFATVAKRMPKPAILEQLLRSKAEPMTYHLVPKGEDWAIRREGSEQDISLHATKKEALSAARGVAQAHEPSRLVVHRADGTIQDSFDYGEDA